MFRNAEELRTLIKQGKSNEEIIEKQLKYLNSEEYLKDKLDTIKENDTDMIIFHHGYIKPDMKISFRGNMVTDISYKFDDIEVYNIVIDLIRNNMDKKGFSINYMMRIIRNYFAISDDSQYKELLDFYKEKLPNDPYFARERLPYILMYYQHSNFDGDITEFGKAYLYNIAYQQTKNESYREMSEKYRASIDWNAIDEIGDIELPISSIKGAGIAACTEFAILEQNILSFMGYDVYMLGGMLKKSNGGEEAHNFNVIRKNDSQFEIIDTAQVVRQIIDGISNAQDLTNLEEIKSINGYGEEVYYSSGSQRAKKTHL